MSTDPRAFAQFRRLLVGVVVEILHDERIDIDLTGLETGFEPESGFRFLWFDNWMRFRGWVRAPLRAEPDAGTLGRLQQRFEAVWPEIVGALGAMPLADRLDITRQEVSVSAAGALEIRFDLEAD